MQRLPELIAVILRQVTWLTNNERFDNNDKIINPTYFYFCKEFKVENINSINIGNHIRLKDPQRHKAKLLEIIQGEYVDKDDNKTVQNITIRN
jgi:hypothetical protein